MAGETTKAARRLEAQVKHAADSIVPAVTELEDAVQRAQRATGQMRKEARKIRKTISQQALEPVRDETVEEKKK